MSTSTIAKRSRSSNENENKNKNKKPKLNTNTKTTTAATATTRSISELSPKEAAASVKRGKTWLADMGLNVTGARDGEYVIGHRDVVKDALLRIHGLVPPSRGHLQDVRNAGLWSEFLEKLNRVPFFATMTLQNREQWLLENQYSSNEHKLTQFPNVYIDLLQLGTSFAAAGEHKKEKNRFHDTMPPAKVQEFMSATEPLAPGDVSLAFTAKTLTFISGYWRVQTLFNVSRDPETVHDPGVIDVDTGTILPNYKLGGAASASDLEVLQLMHFPPILTTKSGGGGGGGLNAMVLFSRILPPLFPTTSAESLLKDATAIRKTCTGYTPATYKSLMQKLIRFRPKYLTFDDHNRHNRRIDAGVALVSVMILLASHHGSFVPDIATFSSGLHGMIKRLLIIAVEDSYVDATDPAAQRNLLSLATAAVLSQRLRFYWRPTESLLQSFLAFALQLWREPRVLTIPIPGKNVMSSMIPAYSLLRPKNGWHLQPTMSLVSALADSVKSFASDLFLLRYAAKHWNDADNIHLRKNREDVAKLAQPETMPMSHMVDQHWAPNFIYHFDFDTFDVCPPLLLLNSKKSSAKFPFASLNREIFQKVTGVNPRHGAPSYTADFEQRSWTRRVRRAQSSYLHSRYVGAATTDTDTDADADADTDSMTIPEIKRAIEALELELGLETKVADDPPPPPPFTYTIQDSWLAGMIGTVKVKIPKNIDMLITLNPRTMKWVAIRQPSRAKLLATDEQKQLAMHQFTENLLKKGLVRLDQISPPIPQWKNGRVKLAANDVLQVSFNNAPPTTTATKWQDWSVVRSGTFVPKKSMPQWEMKVKSLLASDFPVKLLRSLVAFLSRPARILSMIRLTRDGGGQDQVPSTGDIAVFQLLRRIADIVPDALKLIPGQPINFSVPFQPMLDHVRKLVIEEVITQSQSESPESPESESPWSGTVLTDSHGYQPRPYQLDSLESMKLRHGRGDLGDFLWLPTGTGKTLIVMMYAAYLKSIGHLPPHMIYTIPKSGALNIIDQLHSFGFKVHLLNKPDGVFINGLPPRIRKLRLGEGVSPVPGSVTLVEHEQLKYFTAELAAISSDALVVVDEVHRMESASLRAQTAMYMALHSREFVAMTATPIISNKVSSLIPWLSQIVKFEVNVRNFWTAANAMIAHQVSTGVQRHYHYEKAEFTIPEEFQEYRKLVPPILGGTAMNMDQIPAARLISRRVATRRLLVLAVQHLEASHVPDPNDDDDGDDGKRKRNGAMIVAQDRNHQLKIYNSLVAILQARLGTDKYNEEYRGLIFQLGVDQSSMNLTDDSVNSDADDDDLRTPDYRVVIVTQGQSSGYELSRLNAFFSSVYPSNQATRDQLEGRIDRLSQRAAAVDYTIVHAGILTNSLDKHNDAAALARALEQLPHEIPKTPPQ